MMGEERVWCGGYFLGQDGTHVTVSTSTSGPAGAGPAMLLLLPVLVAFLSCVE